MSTILCFSVNMGCCVYINEEKNELKWFQENGCNITKSEKCKGVWILSVPTVYTVMAKNIGTLGKYDQRRLWKLICIVNPFDFFI